MRQRLTYAAVRQTEVVTLQRHFSVLTKFAHVELRLSGRLRRRRVIFYKLVNPCDRSACSTSVAVGVIYVVHRQLLPQALLTLAQRGHPPPNGRHMLAQAAIDA